MSSRSETVNHGTSRSQKGGKDFGCGTCLLQVSKALRDFRYMPQGSAEIMEIDGRPRQGNSRVVVSMIALLAESLPEPERQCKSQCMTKLKKIRQGGWSVLARRSSLNRSDLCPSCQDSTLERGADQALVLWHHNRIWKMCPLARRLRLYLRL